MTIPKITVQLSNSPEQWEAMSDAEKTSEAGRIIDYVTKEMDALLKSKSLAGSSQSERVSMGRCKAIFDLATRTRYGLDKSLSV